MGLAAALAWSLAVHSSHAEDASMADQPDRWLLIFDTSIAMERCLPATTTELQNLFFGNMNGELTAGDSIGVWTFDQKLTMGKFPLVEWQPQQASETTSSLVTFLDYDRYYGKTHFASITPALREVIAQSRRLTILLFCDGRDKLKLTPCDDGINRAFNAVQPKRQKDKVPFVVVIRTQNGHFVGATVNLPPGKVDLPVFPPLPAPATPRAATPVASAQQADNTPAQPSVPPLVIVGTNVITNPEEIKKLSGP